MQTYYEPFLGGGAVFFHLRPVKAVLSDVNPELVNVYRCVRDRVEDLILLLKEHHQHHSHSYYYQIRASRPLKDVERAARLIYLNKTCFNGLYRENSKGEFNVPMGRYQNPAICDPDLLRAAALALQNTEICIQPFDALLEKPATPDDFVYFDPPYHPLSSTSNFTAYNRYRFSESDQVRLKTVFAELANKGVRVMLSNSDCPFIRELYHGFNIQTVSAARAINSAATKRGRITEVLITSH
jgi:DNA adenine methylase